MTLSELIKLLQHEASKRDNDPAVQRAFDCVLPDGHPSSSYEDLTADDIQFYYDTVVI